MRIQCEASCAQNKASIFVYCNKIIFGLLSLVAFDPASFYGHHEFDLAIAGMFGGFSKAFYDAYHKEIPKEKGFDKRHQLYQLFHHFNHW